MRPVLLALIALMVLPAHIAAQPADPYIWLEDVILARAMAWVEAHNAASTAACCRPTHATSRPL